MPASVRKILSTKQLPQQVLADAIAKGVVIECIPFIKITYRDPNVIAARLGHVSPEDVFIFTSKHAIQAARHLLAPCKNDAYCISGSTKETLGTVTNMKLAGAASDAVRLCKQIHPDMNRTYFFCCGNKRLSVLPDYLQTHGIACNEVICYDTEPLMKKVEAVYDAILFFSPSAAASYFTCNQPYEHQHFHCIGPTTAAAVEPYASQNIFISKEPSTASLLSQIEQISNS